MMERGFIWFNSTPPYWKGKDILIWMSFRKIASCTGFRLPVVTVHKVFISKLPYMLYVAVTYNSQIYEKILYLSV